jgi:uncharacterized protein (TIGR00730 family)
MFLRKVTVFCAASNRINKVYPESAYNLGRLLAQSGREIIFGAGNIGSMNALANGVLSQNGTITGVIPGFMDILELTHNGLTNLIVVKDMHERESIMLKNADAIIALPGGSGTFSELLQAITWKQLGLIICPIIIINVNNYFEPLLAMLNKAVDEDFMRLEYKALWLVCSTPEQALSLLN